jgi:aryl-alcohol dehydrogenase-like predicted oxidoreductase
MLVIVKEALANGHLVRDGASGQYSDARGMLSREAARLETTVDALAIAAALAQPWADIVLSGAATAKQLPRDVLPRLAGIAVTPRDYWGHRAKGAWT